MGLSNLIRKRKNSDPQSSPLRSPTTDSYLPGPNRPKRALPQRTRSAPPHTTSESYDLREDTAFFLLRKPSATSTTTPVTPPRSATKKRDSEKGSIAIPYLGSTRVITPNPPRIPSTNLASDSPSTSILKKFRGLSLNPASRESRVSFDRSTVSHRLNQTSKSNNDMDICVEVMPSKSSRRMSICRPSQSVRSSFESVVERPIRDAARKMVSRISLTLDRRPSKRVRIMNAFKH